MGALRRNAGGHDAVNDVNALCQADCGAAPAMQNGGVHDDHALSPLGMLAGQHEAEVAAHGVTNEVCAVADFLGHEVMQLLDEVGPVWRDGVAWVVSVLLDGSDCVALRAPALEQRLVCGCGEAVGVGEDDGAVHVVGGHGVVAFGRHWDGDSLIGCLPYFQSRCLV